MLTITITFALLVALWGFSGALVTYARRSLVRVKPPARTAPARRRAGRSVVSAGH